MKYGYAGKDKELIQDYKILDNKIIITFLDDSKYVLPFNKENETNILNEMLKQAEDRNQSPTLRRTKLKILLDILVSAGEITAASLCVANSDNLKSNIGVAVMAGSATVINGVFSINHNVKLEELKKYNTYLAIKEQLENTPDPYAFHGVNNSIKLTINTLDYYSLKDLKTIKHNLETIQNHGYSKETINPVFTQKISK